MRSIFTAMRDLTSPIVAASVPRRGEKMNVNAPS